MVEDPPTQDLKVQQEEAARNALPDGTIPPAGVELGSQSSEQVRDTFNQRPVSEPPKEPLSEQSGLNITQNKPARSTLPDGTIPPEGARIGRDVTPGIGETYSERPTPEPSKEPLVNQGLKAESLQPTESGKSAITTPRTSEETMKIQRLSEFQIPSFSGSEERAPTAGQDTYSERPTVSSPDLSSLPRVKIPQSGEDTQGSDEHVQDGQINQDVYYSSKGHARQPPIPATEAVPEQDEVPEGINTDVFHSPRVASLLNSGGREDKRKAYEMRMKAAKRTPIDRSPLAQGKDQDTFNVRQSSDSPSEAGQSIIPEATEESKSDYQPKEIDQDTREFAESLAKDAMSPQAPAPEVCYIHMNRVSPFTGSC